MHHIRTLVDVRTNPHSRFSPQFNTRHMQENLGAIAYRHARELGGKDPQPIPEIRRSLESLLYPVNQDPADRMCLVCSEGDYRECHRHYLLTPLVRELGFQVQQILPNGGLVLDEGPTPATLTKMAPYLPK